MNLSPRKVDKKMDASEHGEPGRWAADGWRTDCWVGRFMGSSVCGWRLGGYEEMEDGGGWWPGTSARDE